MRIDVTRARLYPVIIADRYGLRYEGTDYLVDVATVAHLIFRDWRPRHASSR